MRKLNHSALRLDSELLTRECAPGPSSVIQAFQHTIINSLDPHRRHFFYSTLFYKITLWYPPQKQLHSMPLILTDKKP